VARARRRAAAPLALLFLARAAVAAPSPAVTPPAARHPLHTSFAELRYDAGRRTLEISLRVFADDFAAAVAHASGSAAATGDDATDRRTLAYLTRALVITDGTGRPIPLSWCGARRAGDLLWLCLRAPLPAGPRDLGVESRVLFDRFADQANIVQATIDGSRRTLLFTRGSGAKHL
jgi:hypothetical protein